MEGKEGKELYTVHMGPEVQNSFKEVPRGAIFANNSKLPKNAFQWPKSKKVKKANPTLILILQEIMSPNFFWAPLGWENDIF